MAPADGSDERQGEGLTPAPSPQTIFALSSGAPPAAIGVIRISGPDVLRVIDAFGVRRPAPRVARLARLGDPATGETLDRALLLWFPGPASATGEDLLELHLHGGRAVIAAVLAALARLRGLRAAEPGEFTRRAMLNGRLDLAEAEGLADLLSAETEAQRRNAQRIADGGLSRDVDRWRLRILDHAASAEAAIDYGDEIDGAFDIAAVQAALTVDAAAIAAMLEAPPAERLRDGVRIVLAGPPNAGKSSLFNALAARDAAIVSPIAGTTRDRVEASVVIDGLPFLLIDTAGLHDGGDDPIERLGIGRAEDAIAAADLILWLGPAAAAPAGAVRIAAKADLGTPDPLADVAVSAVTGAGLTVLRRCLVDAARGLLGRGDIVSLNARQRGHLGEVVAALGDAARQPDLVMMAEELRRASASLDALTGRAGVEDMLDALFGRFCLGK